MEFIIEGVSENPVTVCTRIYNLATGTAEDYDKKKHEEFLLNGLIEGVKKTIKTDYSQKNLTSSSGYNIIKQYS